MALIVWRVKYRVGVEAIDHQHRELFGLLNSLGGAMRSGAQPGEVMALFGRLLEAAESHFNAEERALAQNGCPEVDRHRLAHNRFLTEAVTFQREVDHAEGAVPLPLMLFLRDWLTEHILEVDKPCAGWLVQQEVA